MVEQVIFKMDKSLKDRVMKKAKKQGTTLSAVFKGAAKAYVENEFDLGLTYRAKLIRDVRQSEKEIREGKIYFGDLDKLVKKINR